MAHLLNTRRDICDSYLEYQSPLRTVLETTLCLFIVVAYIPQYIKILRTKSTHGIRSRFALFHCLFSTFTFGIRLFQISFYRAPICAVLGRYSPGWKAYSALLGSIEVIVQFMCAVVLLFIYLLYYVPPQPDDPVERPTANLSSRRIIVAATSVIAVVVPVSIGFTSLFRSVDWNNDQSQRPGMFEFFFLLGLWVFALIVLAFAMLVAQFVYQVRTVRVLRSSGSFSPLSALLLGVALLFLGVAQYLWAGSSEEWRMFWILPSMHVYLLYVGAGLGFLVLFAVSRAVGESGAEGGITL